MGRRLRRYLRRKKIQRNTERMEEEPCMYPGHPLNLNSLIPSVYKRMRRKLRRSKAKSIDIEDVPKDKKNDVWDWW